MAILRSLIVSLVARTENFDQGMRKAERSLSGFSTATTQFQGKIRGLATELLKFSAAQAGVNSVLDATRKLFQTGMHLERLNQDLLNLTGNSAAAQQATLRLQQTARDTGFSLQVLGQGFKALQAASQGTSLSFEDTTRLFEQFVRAAGATGVAEEQLGNVFEEVTELLSQQTIKMTDLTPLLKQFPGIMDAMARAMGVSRAELERMGKDGELLTTIVLPRLAEQLGQMSTHNVMPLTTAVQHLGTAWEELFQTFGKLAVASGVVTAIEAVTKAVQALVDLINASKSAWEILGKILMWRPGFIEPPPAPPAAPAPPAPAARPTVDTSRAREIERLQKEFATKRGQLEALTASTEEKMRRFPRDAASILQSASDAAEQLMRDLQVIISQLQRSIKELGQQASKTTAISPARAAIRSQIQALAPQYGLDPLLVEALIAKESAFNPRAVSSKGAKGLMQIMPEHYARLGITDPFDIGQNLKGGMQILKELTQQFGGDVEKVLAAYNAGPGAVLKYGGIPPFKETQAFVPGVLAERERLKASGAGAMEQTAQATQTATTRLKEMEAELAKTQARYQKLAEEPERLLRMTERLAAEDRYVDLIIQTEEELASLTLTEDELKRTSLDRMQAQAQAADKLRQAFRQDPAATATAAGERLATALEGIGRRQAAESVTGLIHQQQRNVDDLVGSLEDQVRVLTLTNRELIAYELHLSNAADWEVRYAQALEAKVERLEMAREAADTVTDALIDMAVTGEISLKNLQETFSRMVLTMLADALKSRESLTKLIEKGLELAINALPGGAGAGSGTASAAEAVAAVAGFRAAGYGGGLQHGGPVVPGRFYTVGEDGPERFYPGVAGTVVPGGARPITIVQNISTPDADSFRRSKGQIAAQMVLAAQQARRHL